MNSFIINYPSTAKERKRWNAQYGLNSIYSGKHWTQRKKDSEYWHLITRAAMQRARIPHKELTNPADVTIYWNDNLDIDNHAYMGKMIVDAMKGWILHDDSRKYFTSVKHDFHDENYILIEIEERT